MSHGDTEEKEKGKTNEGKTFLCVWFSLNPFYAFASSQGEKPEPSARKGKTY
jgi:hypothetical protein